MVNTKAEIIFITWGDAGVSLSLSFSLFRAGSFFFFEGGAGTGGRGASFLLLLLLHINLTCAGARAGRIRACAGERIRDASSTREHITE